MSSIVRGSIAFVLHAHLPYVRQADRTPALEERWLYEAVADTYLPLVDMCDRLLADGVRFRLTLSVSPTLLAMLDDPELIGRTRRHLASLHRLAQSETLRLWGDAAFTPAAQMYESRYRRLLKLYDRLDGDLIGKLRELRDSGCLELIVCAATHAFLPLTASAAAIRAQLGAAVAEFRRHFGDAPAGVWLPECGYTPAIEPQLAALGLRYFIAADHALPAAAALGRPVLTRGGACAFLRDPESAEQVWSARTGYPGAAEYRDYYRDIGFDLGRSGGAEWDYIKPYLLPNGERLATGLKYYRVTGADAAEKAPYCPEGAARKAREHAGHFVAARRAQARRMTALGADAAEPNASRSLIDPSVGPSSAQAPPSPCGEPPVIVCPYDAELFGHWWFEGPLWLEAVLRELDQPTTQIDVVLQTTTLNEYRKLHPPAADRPVDLPPSSWGRGGFAEVWLQPSTAWAYPLLHAAEERMTQAAAAHPDPQRLPELTRRLLDQAGRELLLAQSSDWTFLLDAGSFTGYAKERIHRHLEHCHTLLDFAAGSPVRGQTRAPANAQPEPGSSASDNRRTPPPSPLDAARYVQRLEQEAPLLPDFSYSLFHPVAALAEAPVPVQKARFTAIAASAADSGSAMEPADAPHLAAQEPISHSPQRPLHILMLAWEYPPHVIGGLARAVCDLSQQLAAAGHDVHVVTCRSGATPAYELASGVHVHRAEVLQSMQAVSFLDWVLQMNLAFADTIAELVARGQKWDVVHAHDWLVFYAAHESKMRFGLPLVATLHATEFGRNQGRLTGELQQRIHALEARLTAEASRVIVCSNAMQEEIARLFQVPSAKIARIPNGIKLPSSLMQPKNPGKNDSDSSNQAASSGVTGSINPIGFTASPDVIRPAQPTSSNASPDVIRPAQPTSSNASPNAFGPANPADSNHPAAPTGHLRPLDGTAAQRPAADASPHSAPRPLLAELLADAARAGDRLLLFLGRLVHEKGVHVLLQALRLVLKRHPNARLLIAGVGPALEALQAQATPLGSRTVFLGFADEEDKRALLAAAELCVFPSLYEPFGIVALEAMASGTPLIVSNVGGLAEIVEHGVTGCTFSAGDVSALALAIVELLDEPERGRLMAEAARQTVRERFNWAGIGECTIELYKAAAAGAF
ncbi:DUF1957 domain-containing protein [Paenibacillus athensensis]|uniref:1,4-alpha-glucan branching enzyme n=1 Tax=Paenibacillus athensensis TaxID=1967502 RepID=A0A4Y8PYC6_9BACL|nr:1,4-alpha-glucan branching protein domain-containing protein [Paenibacillus athensensis]MCD1259395.1 DUF1957 domain-containing protein [Paenibacillus athensensis]